jgi:hypothetical protein
MPPATTTAPSARARAPRSWFRRLSVNDWVSWSYLVGLNVAWLLADPSPELSSTGPMVLGLLLVFLVLVPGFSRSSTRAGFWRALSYRLGHFGCVQLSYFVFAGFLPAVSPGSLDLELLAFDMAVFGAEPAVLLDSWISATSTEWFSFFYYSYFFLLASHVIPIVFFGRDHHLLSEFALGLTLVTTIGHTCYMLVPGFGPYTMPELFENELPPGLWWQLVTQLVHQGGAQKDIFPSLHTALPTFILLFSFHNRSLYPYRLTWPLVGWFTANIIIATMFLRWHYLIDVVAGLALAAASFEIATRVTKWEVRYRTARGLGRIWPGWEAERSASSLTERALSANAPAASGAAAEARRQETPAQNPS